MEQEYISEWPPPPAKLKRSASPPVSQLDTHHSQGVAALDSDLARSYPIDTSIDSLLAKWWKRHYSQQNSRDHRVAVPESTSPKTTLYHVSLLPDAQLFIKRRLAFLQSLGKPADRAAVMSSISQCYHASGNIPTALDSAQQAVDASNDCDPDLQWRLATLKRQDEVASRQQAAISSITTPHRELVFPTPIQVERRAAESLSYEEFLVQYAMTHTPVIITGLVSQMTTPPWTLDHIKSVAGGLVAPLRKSVSGSVEWAGLEQAENMKLAEFISDLENHKSGHRYLFDWSLPLHCPELANEMNIPKYFAGDLLQRTPPGSLYRDTWPSLFIAPAGICSQLHVDAFGSNFWMALFQGRKRWLFFPPKDLPFLYPIHSPLVTDNSFAVELSAPDLSQHPLLSLTTPLESVLQAGEVLFVPAGCPHWVENLDTSLAVSANFVDMSNIGRVKDKLSLDSLIDSRAAELLSMLQNSKFCTDVDKDQTMLSFKKFKTIQELL